MVFPPVRDVQTQRDDHDAAAGRRARPPTGHRSGCGNELARGTAHAAKAETRGHRIGGALGRGCKAATAQGWLESWLVGSALPALPARQSRLVGALFYAQCGT